MRKDFNRLLKELDENELRDELKIIYDRFPVVKEYYKLELSGNTKAVVDKYKKALYKSFFTGRRRMNRRARSESKKVLKAFSEVSIHSRDLVELYFYRVEIMVDAVEYYNIENEPFLNSTVKAFEEALRLAKNELLLETFQPQILELVKHYRADFPIVHYPLYPTYLTFFPQEP